MNLSLRSTLHLSLPALSIVVAFVLLLCLELGIGIGEGARESAEFRAESSLAMLSRDETATLHTKVQFDETDLAYQLLEHAVWTLPTDSLLQNANLECSEGVYQVTDESGQTLTIPNHWVWTPISGTPKLISTNIRVSGSCDGSGFIEAIEGDSFMFRSQDIETPPVPGKPFDVAIYQQVQTLTGTAYSVSGFMVSFCGGSASPNDCPEGYYISKMVGLDPSGAAEPLADRVAWAESQAPHDEVRWVNLRVAAQAISSTMTVFVRVHSPFQWHGNHAIADLFSMVEAPTATFIELPESIQVTGTTGIPTGTRLVQGNVQEIRWTGSLSPDIEALDREDYELIYEIEYRHNDVDTWSTLVEQQVGDGCIRFLAPELDQTYYFRIRALAARPESGGHRYLSIWSEPEAIHFSTVSGPSGTAPDSAEALYLPVMRSLFQASCL
ncbi:MAG: hypothetical protein AAF702_26700 [Chloroflexota bacterium]